MTAITRTEIHERERLAFLPDLFTDSVQNRPAYATGETATYQIAQRLCGLQFRNDWRFFRLSNGTGYLAPVIYAASVPVHWAASLFAGSMSPDALGITATVFALSACADSMRGRNTAAEDALLLRHYRLKEYAAQHAEAVMIGRAID